MIEFTPWPKIARLNRDITITEKIDGTNAAVGIVHTSLETGIADHDSNCKVVDRGGFEVNGLHNVALVYAQSRKSIITPGQDNFGFARWVYDNAEALAAILGPGLHFGEWWGSGIQRGYGLPKGEKRFSLFNTKRWGPQNEHGLQAQADDGVGFVPGLDVVPVLYEGPFNAGKGVGAFQWALRPWEKALDDLELNGSHAAPGFMRPEGIVLYHQAANMMFKVTLEGDDTPKSL